jgi:hypothetical protein
VKKKNPHIGSTFESWLDETGLREDVTAAAIKAVIARQIATRGREGDHQCVGLERCDRGAGSWVDDWLRPPPRSIIILCFPESPWDTARPFEVAPLSTSRSRSASPHGYTVHLSARSCAPLAETMFWFSSRCDHCPRMACPDIPANQRPSHPRVGMQPRTLWHCHGGGTKRASQDLAAEPVAIEE